MSFHFDITNYESIRERLSNTKTEKHCPKIGKNVISRDRTIKQFMKQCRHKTNKYKKTFFTVSAKNYGVFAGYQNYTPE